MLTCWGGQFPVVWAGAGRVPPAPCAPLSLSLSHPVPLLVPGSCVKTPFGVSRFSRLSHGKNSACRVPCPRKAKKNYIDIWNWAGGFWVNMCLAFRDFWERLHGPPGGNPWPGGPEGPGRHAGRCGWRGVTGALWMGLSGETVVGVPDGNTGFPLV